MKEQLISFETAKLAKEKGFDLITPYNYNTDKSLWDSNLIYYRGYPAPTQSLLQKWLREIKNLSICIEPSYYFTIWEMYMDKSCYEVGISDKSQTEYETYEEALEAGLKQALTLI